MKTIKTSNTNEDILVDDEDYERCIKFKWWRKVSSNGKGICGKPWYNHKPTGIANFILKTKNKVDHINRNPLNNQKSNFRFGTSSQHQANRNKQKNNTTGYIGVHILKLKLYQDRFSAYIQKDGKVIYLGSFDTAEEAAKFRDKKAIEFFGDFAVLNFPNNSTI